MLSGSFPASSAYVDAAKCTEGAAAGSMPGCVAAAEDAATNAADVGSELYRLDMTEDIYVIAVFTTLLLIARHIVSRYLLKPTARSFGIHKQLKLQKFAEAGWFFVYYLPIFCWGLSIVLRYELSFPLEQMFVNFPQEVMSYEVKLYLSVQYSFYFHALFVVLFLESRRKDFMEMTIHHLATIGLMSAARNVSFLNIAITVLVLHDFSDIFLYLAKVFNYMQLENITNLTFTVFAASFAVARLFFFPCVVRSWHVNAPLAHPEIDPGTYYGTTTGFVTLLCLHCFWFRSIIIMVMEALGKGKLEKDIRSDDDK